MTKKNQPASRANFRWALGAFILLMGCSGEAQLDDTQNNETANPLALKALTPEIRIVGSSTVYPFSTKVAQEFKNKTGYNVVVEATGSGGGHKLFCEGVGEAYPDITSSSRRQKRTEFARCTENGVREIIEIKIGVDGIVMANARQAESYRLSLKQIFLAFAKDIPASEEDCSLQANPHERWADIDPALPDRAIEAYGPPTTSGTRDAFVEQAMERGAGQIACLAALRDENPASFRNIAHRLREDGKWIDTGENDNAIVQTLVNTPNAVGIFGYSFLDQNTDKIKGATIEGYQPTLENIAAGEYPISRSLYFYLKGEHVSRKAGLREFAEEFTSEEAWGPGGYLEEIGLVPLAQEMREKYSGDVENLTAYAQ